MHMRKLMPGTIDPHGHFTALNMKTDFDASRMQKRPGIRERYRTAEPRERSRMIRKAKQIEQSSPARNGLARRRRLALRCATRGHSTGSNSFTKKRTASYTRIFMHPSVLTRRSSRDFSQVLISV
jgi:hypothetical protein